ncbi:MAG: chemotaxis protein CheC [Candidatus Woesearchaeota archaeon]
MKLSESEIDALREVGNVGIGNATTALSKILNKKIDINIPETRFVPLESFAEELGGPERIVNSLYLDFDGDVKGECIFAFPEKSALKLSDLILGRDAGTAKEMGEEESSAFMEMSNIFVGSYLSSLANMCELKIFPAVPNMACDMIQAVIDVLLINLAKHADSMLMVKAKISLEGHNIDGDFLLVFEEESLIKLLKILEEKYGLVR